MPSTALLKTTVKGVPLSLVGNELTGVRPIRDTVFLNRSLKNPKMLSVAHDATDALGLSVTAQAEGHMPLDVMLEGAHAGEDLVTSNKNGRKQEQFNKPNRKSLRAQSNESRFLPQYNH